MDNFWTEGNLIALGAREIVKRHEADMAELTRLEIENRDRAWYVSQERDAPDYNPDDVAFRQPGVPVTDAQVEALARVLHKAQDGFYCRYGNHATTFDDYAPLWLAEARAALAHIGAVPGVDPDAWASMKPVVIDLANGYEIYLNETDYLDMDLVFSRKGDPQKRYWINPEMARKLAIAAASYATAHGRPVDLRTPLSVTDCPHCDGSGSALVPSPPIADADTLEKLAEIGLKAKEAVWGGPIKMNLAAEVAGVAAILRAAKARVDVEPGERLMLEGGHTWLEKDLIELLNSRIRYGVEVPPDIGSPGPLITVPKDPVWHGPTRVEAEAKWKELTQHGNRWAYAAQQFRDWLLPLLPESAAPRPWLRDPVGWELDVTDSEIYNAYADADNGPAAALDFCRSRIRPVFECPECAERTRHYNEVGAALQQVADIARAALEGE